MDPNHNATPPRPRGRGIYLLPNLLTTGGLFGGFFAIIAASQGRFETACIAIFVAAVLDGLDGRVARLTNTQSEFGVQYDSLADLVSFGMAPALVMYHWALVAMKLDGTTAGKLGWLGAFLYAACAALRLARFNSQVGGDRQALVHRPGQPGRGRPDGQFRLDLHRPSAGAAKNCATSPWR
jgi:CDP-diacylglycerol--serine O-phosphatidyltransferase